jgi:tRNA nucleotidyltransferase (CCA-adding enzyme)
MSNTLGKLEAVSKERISDELIKILNSSHPSIAFNHFYNCGMLEILLPTICEAAHKNFTEFKNALEDIDVIESEKAYIKLARILSITPRKGYTDVLKNLKFSNDFIKNTTHIVQFIELDIDSLSTGYEIRKFISIAGKNYIGDILSLLSGMKSINKDKLITLIDKIDCEINAGAAFSIKDLNITGTDIINDLKITPGPKIGSTLNCILVQVLQKPEINVKSLLLEIAHDILIS